MPVTIDARENVTTPFRLDRERGAPRLRSEDKGWLTPCGIVVGRTPLGLPDRVSGLLFVNDLGDADAIVRKDPLASDGLVIKIVRVNAQGRTGPRDVLDIVGHLHAFYHPTPA